MRTTRASRGPAQDDAPADGRPFVLGEVITGEPQLYLGHATTAPHTPTPDVLAARRSNVFWCLLRRLSGRNARRLFMEALHRSRRNQAAGVIRQYKHLRDPTTDTRCAASRSKGAQQTSENKTPSQVTNAMRSLAMKILIAAVVIGLGVFHIVGDVVLRGHSVAAKADAAGSIDYGD